MKTIKNFFKSTIIQCSVFLLVIFIGLTMVSIAKSKVKYLDVPCMNCGSDEVGDFGEDFHHAGWHKGHCFDCGLEFYVED